MKLLSRKRSDQTASDRNTVLLENVSAEHIILQLGSGELRLDKGRRRRFRADVLKLSQIRDLVDHGQIAVSD